jgi:hypothetical protein
MAIFDRECHNHGQRPDRTAPVVCRSARRSWGRWREAGAGRRLIVKSGPLHTRNVTTSSRCGLPLWERGGRDAVLRRVADWLCGAGHRCLGRDSQVAASGVRQLRKLLPCRLPGTLRLGVLPGRHRCDGARQARMRASAAVTQPGTKRNGRPSSRERSGNGGSRLAQATFKEKTQVRALMRTHDRRRARSDSAAEGGRCGSPRPRGPTQRPSSGRIWATGERAAPSPAVRFDGNDFTP